LATVAFGQAALFLWQLKLVREGLGDAKIAALAAQDGALAAKDSADIAKLTMIARDRAYVHHDGFRWISHLSERTGRYFWRVHPRWINSGNTPTRNLAVHVDYDLRDDLLPDNFVFSYVRGGIPAMIPPHGIIESQFRDIPADELILIKGGQKFSYVWGTVTYRDVFHDTPDRITRFCVVAIDVTGEPDREWHAQDNPLEISFIAYDRRNCADEDCKS
jgi:hypothetical protein